jgi:hypothetical protein
MHLTKKIVTLLLLCFCSCDKEMTLELKDVQDFKLVEKRDTSQIEISGLAFHSALGVKKMTTERQGQDLIVKLHLVLAGEKYSPRFDYTVAVPSGVDRVLFGTDRKEIWKRP